MRQIHQKMEIYIDGTRHPGKASLTIDDRNAKTLVVREIGKPDIASLSDVTIVSEERTRRLLTIMWMGTTTEGDEVTITGVKKGCGCGGR